MMTIIVTVIWCITAFLCTGLMCATIMRVHEGKDERIKDLTDSLKAHTGDGYLVEENDE